jgi:hypothetical protein
LCVTLFRCCLPCRGGNQAPGEINNTTTIKLRKDSELPASETPSYSPIDSPHHQITNNTHIVDKNDDSIGLVTTSVSVSVSTSPTPSLTTPLLSSENCENFIVSHLTNVVATVESQQTAIYTASSITTTSTTSSPSIVSQLNQIQILVQPSTTSSTTSSRMCQNHILTLPHIDEDDEDENNGFNSLSATKFASITNVVGGGSGGTSSSSLSDDRKVQINNPQVSSSLSPSPKIKVSRIKFSQPSSSSSSSLASGGGGDSSISSDSSAATTIIINPCDKMQAESGTIADLQQIQQRYLKNRRHTLANTAAINLR